MEAAPYSPSETGHYIPNLILVIINNSLTSLITALLIIDIVHEILLQGLKNEERKGMCMKNKKNKRKRE
jgi:hypothetical protein